MYDYGARFYSPVLGRFISPDTVVPQPGNPQALNRYSYGLNNPVKYRDPTGHCVVGGHWMSDDTSACGGNNSLVQFSGDWDPQRRNLVNRGASALSSRLTEVVAADQERAMGMVVQTGYHADPHAFSQISGLWGQSSSHIFRAVLGDITFVRSSESCAKGCWGETHIPNIEMYTNAFNAKTYQEWGEQNAVHELGHALAQRTGWDQTAQNYRAYAELADSGLPDRPAGFAGDFPGWQQSDQNTANERFADMVLGWTYNTWGPGDPGARRSQYMETNMPFIIALAVSDD